MEKRAKDLNSSNLNYRFFFRISGDLLDKQKDNTHHDYRPIQQHATLKQSSESNNTRTQKLQKNPMRAQQLEQKQRARLLDDY